MPGSYYGEGSGAQLALLTNPQRKIGPMRVGAIGLGIGTIAAYSRPGDVFRFYEINPAVIRIAKGDGGYFTYLSDAAARIEIVPGDARLSLEEEAARHDFQNFDVLLVDAFNGDSIPVHLLTSEAMELYLSHLRGPDSVIVVHTTNLFVNLAPVVVALAETYALKATLIRSTERTGILQPSVFILLSQGASLEAPEIRKAGYPIRLEGPRIKNELPLWTDDYSNVATLFAR
jgi:spermidine synthase